MMPSGIAGGESNIIYMPDYVWSLEWGFCFWVEGLFARLDFHGWVGNVGGLSGLGSGSGSQWGWWDIGIIFIKHCHNRNTMIYS